MGGSGAAEWLEAAVAGALERYPDVPETELERLCAEALKLAEGVARDERECLAVFEAELDREMEERAVLGTPSSVLPSASPGEADVPSTLTAEGDSERQGRPESQAGASDGPSARRVAPRPETGMDYVLAAGRLRFHHGLEPAEIESELEIDRDYYTRCMHWLLEQVDAKLDREHSGHVNRAEMATFAAGLASIKQAFAFERHMRECRPCAGYLADLLDDAAAAFDLAGEGKPEEGTAAPEATTPAAAGEPLPASLATRDGRTSYTTQDVWAALPKRRRPAVPIMSLKAQSLRRYMPAADPVAEAAAPADPDPDA
ncbi:MAG: hypothetical protein ACRDL0_16805, partial [Thermoleophilaceae bacterium]